MKVPYYLLGLLIRYGPQHGYRLKQIISEQIADFAKIKLPTIYYHLERMEQKGFVTASVGREGNRPEKTVYAVTDLGRKNFTHLIDRLMEEKYAPEFGLDGILYFYEAVDKERLLGQLTLKELEMKKRLRTLDRHQKNLAQRQSESASLFSRAIFSHHRLHLEAELKWVAEMIKTLS